MSSGQGKASTKQVKLLDRFTKKRPEFKPYKINLAIDLHERLRKLASDANLSEDAVNDALNYAIRKLVTQLEREARDDVGPGTA